MLESAAIQKPPGPLGEDEKVDRSWLRMVDLSLAMVQNPSTSLAPFGISLTDPPKCPLSQAAKIINEKERNEALDVRKQCLKDSSA